MLHIYIYIYIYIYDISRLRVKQNGQNEGRGEKLIAAEHVTQLCEMLLTSITGYPVTRVDTQILFYFFCAFAVSNSYYF